MFSRFSSINARTLSNSVARKTARSRKQRKRPTPPGLTFEKLEDRKLLAGITFNAGELVVTGTGLADTIDLAGNADLQSFTVSINNDPSMTQSFTYAQVDSLKVYAGDGDDTVTNTLAMPTTIFGGLGDDYIEGGDGDDIIYGDGAGTPVTLGAVKNGIAARDNASGGGYILFSEESVFTRFSPSLYSGNSDHLIAVVQQGGQWFYDNNLTLTEFTPRSTDLLVADVDFTNNTISSLQGQTGVVNGIERGFASGDLVFEAQRLGNSYNDGEFKISGTEFLRNSGGNDTISGGEGDDTIFGGEGDDIIYGDGAGTSATLGAVKNGIAARDNASGVGYILFSEESVFTRFSPSLYSGNSDHLIAVVQQGDQWFYDTNLTLTEFTPRSTDLLVADVDFTNNTISSLQGQTGVVNGIERGFASGDLVFEAQRLGNSYNDGEFKISGTEFFRNSSGNDTILGGDGDDTIFGGEGEDIINGDGAGTPVTLGAVKNGIAARDNASGAGYILFSEESVFTRFSPSLYSGNSDHLIAVVQQGDQWFYDTNLTLTEFTPRSTDLLVADVDFTNNTISSLQGQTGVVNGIERGFASGDLVFEAQRLGNSYNDGEFKISGTEFFRNSGGGNDTIFGGEGNDTIIGGEGDDIIYGDDAGAPVTLGAVKNGIAARDNASGVGYILFSEESVFTRFSPSLYSGNSDHLIAVVQQGGQWFYDTNLTLTEFTPRSTDLLVADVDFTNNNISSLQGQTGVVNGIERGFASGDLVFEAQRLGNSYNDGEFKISGTEFLRNNGGDGTILGGDDRIEGNAGLDRLNGGNGNDWLNGGADRDIISGSFGDDVLHGEGGDDYLAGNDGNDSLYGQEGADTLLGQAGDDLLDAGNDQIQDRLTGGTGLDQFVVLGNIGSGSVDVVNDRAGFETHNGFDGTLTALVELDGDTLFVRGMPGADRIRIDAKNGQDEFELRLERVLVGTYSTAAIAKVVIDGGGGNDNIDNHDSIVPLEVDGGDGDDTIHGGRGDDDLSGGNGDDEIYGEEGDDFIRGGEGNDDIHGHEGNDRLSGNQGNDTIYGHDGEDVINGGLGNDRAFGGDDNDFVGGNEGDDELRGDRGNDTLRGGDGDDELHGGSDNDRLFGDAGADELRGNSGVDAFFADEFDDVRDQSSNETVETGPLATASIGDLVFVDADGDGVFDAGETGLEGAVVKLFSGASEIASQTTGSDGQYSFGALAAGDYRVELAAESILDYEITTAASVNVTLADGETNSIIDFGAQELPPGTGSIGDLVFEDLNGNGIIDSGEPGVAGIIINLLRSGVQVSSQSTDANGQYTFDGLRAGSYEVVLSDDSLPSGKAINIDSMAVVVADGEQNSDIDFAVVERDNTVDLAALLLPFGTGLTNSVSSIVFNGLVGDASNVTSVGNVTFVDTNANRIVFVEDAASGDELLEGSLVRLAGTLPAQLPNETAISLADNSQRGETLHVGPAVEGGIAPIVALDGLGSGRTIASLNGPWISSLGELSLDPIPASTANVISALVSDTSAQFQIPATAAVTVGGFGGTEHPNASTSIVLDDGRQLNITTKTDVEAIQLTGLTDGPRSQEGTIEFKITANFGNVGDVHILQFVTTVSLDDQGNPRDDFFDLRTPSVDGRIAFTRTNEEYVDAIGGTSAFYEAGGLSQRSSAGDSLTVWDAPSIAKRPSGGIFKDEFTTYVVVGNTPVYEISWENVFGDSIENGRVTSSYENITGRLVSPTELPLRLITPVFSSGFTLDARPIPVRNPIYFDPSISLP